MDRTACSLLAGLGHTETRHGDSQAPSPADGQLCSRIFRGLDETKQSYTCRVENSCKFGQAAKHPWCDLTKQSPSCLLYTSCPFVAGGKAWWLHTASIRLSAIMAGPHFTGVTVSRVSWSIVIGLAVPASTQARWSERCVSAARI